MASEFVNETISVAKSILHNQPSSREFLNNLKVWNEWAESFLGNSQIEISDDDAKIIEKLLNYLIDIMADNSVDLVHDRFLTSFQLSIEILRFCKRTEADHTLQLLSTIKLKLEKLDLLCPLDGKRIEQLILCVAAIFAMDDVTSIPIELSHSIIQNVIIIYTKLIHIISQKPSRRDLREFKTIGSDIRKAIITTISNIYNTYPILLVSYPTLFWDLSLKKLTTSLLFSTGFSSIVKLCSYSTIDAEMTQNLPNADISHTILHSSGASLSVSPREVFQFTEKVLQHIHDALCRIEKYPLSIAQEILASFTQLCARDCWPILCYGRDVSQSFIDTCLDLCTSSQASSQTLAVSSVFLSLLTRASRTLPKLPQRRQSTSRRANEDIEEEEENSQVEWYRLVLVAIQALCSMYQRSQEPSRPCTEVLTLQRMRIRGLLAVSEEDGTSLIGWLVEDLVAVRRALYPSMVPPLRCTHMSAGASILESCIAKSGLGTFGDSFDAALAEAQSISSAESEEAGRSVEEMFGAADLDPQALVGILLEITTTFRTFLELSLPPEYQNPLEVNTGREIAAVGTGEEERIWESSTVAILKLSLKASRSVLEEVLVTVSTSTWKMLAQVSRPAPQPCETNNQTDSPLVGCSKASREKKQNSDVLSGVLFEEDVVQGCSDISTIVTLVCALIESFFIGDQDGTKESFDSEEMSSVEMKAKIFSLLGFTIMYFAEILKLDLESNSDIIHGACIDGIHSLIRFLNVRVNRIASDSNISFERLSPNAQIFHRIPVDVIKNAVVADVVSRNIRVDILEHFMKLMI